MIQRIPTATWTRSRAAREPNRSCTAAMKNSGTTRNRGEEMRARPVSSSTAQTMALDQWRRMMAMWCFLICRRSMASACSPVSGTG